MKSSTNQFDWLGISMITIAIAMLASTAANASLLVADYHLGEDDPGATAGSIGNNTTVDSSANGFDLTRTGSLITPSPTYSSNAAPGTDSTLSMAFVSADSDVYSLPAPVTTATKNVFMEAWVYPTAAPAGTGGYVVLNGNGANGYGFLDFGGVWNFIESGTGHFNSASAVVLNQWVHLSLLLDSSGALSGYINGTLVVTQAAPAITPSSDFFVGSGFNGIVDEVEVFTPEPASASILLVSGLAMTGLRRRR